MYDITYRPRFMRTVGRLRPRGTLLGRLIETLTTFQARAEQRRDLGRLDDRALKDIGITRADVELECNKPFWQP